MENSKAYKFLVDQIDATGSKKLDGYYPNIMDEIYENEREDAEDLIWNTFHKNKDTDLAQFMPKLQKYDGIAALKNALKESKIPSDNSVNIACVLYESLNEEKYLDIIELCIDKDPNNISYVAKLSGCRPCKKTYEILSNIYVKSDNRTIRSTAVTGILYNKGFITDPYNTQEMMKILELKRLFLKKDMENRREMIRKLDNGELEIYK